jgi:hypothetical protein
MMNLKWWPPVVICFLAAHIINPVTAGKPGFMSTVTEKDWDAFSGVELGWHLREYHDTPIGSGEVVPLQIKECDTLCRCPKGTGLRDGATACCVFKGTVDAKSTLSRQSGGAPGGCKVEIRMRPVVNKWIKGLVDIVLNVRPVEATQFGVSGKTRCDDLIAGEPIFFSGKSAFAIFPTVFQYFMVMPVRHAVPCICIHWHTWISSQLLFSSMHHPVGWCCSSLYCPHDIALSDANL